MTEDFILTWFPHGYCLAWDWRLITFNVISNFATFVSYCSLAFLIMRAWLCNQVPVLISQETAPMWASFIFSCGMTHLTTVFTLWEPIYWIQTFFLIATGIISSITAGIVFADTKKV